MARPRNEHRRRLRHALAGRGRRFTRQRAKVYEVLAGTDQHPTAEELFRKVKQALPSVSLATVYKSLDALVECDLAQKLTYGDGSAHYDANVAEHPHMRDTGSGRVLDVPADLMTGVAVKVPEDVVAQIERRTGFKVTGLRVEFLGRLGRLPQPPHSQPSS